MTMAPASWNGLRILCPVMAALLCLSAITGCSAPAPPPPPIEAPEAPRAPVFTQTQYDAILYDMTYGQVMDILGTESTRQESTYNEGESDYVKPSLTAWHYWENEDGSYIKAGFTDKKLVEKSADKLPQ